MTNRIFIDTSFIIALINQNDQYHRIAEALSDRYIDIPLVTTDAVLLEIGNALAKKYKVESIKIIEYLTTSTDVKIINLNPSLFKKAFDLYKSYEDKEWSLTDCISFVVMEKLDIRDALTSDRHFAQAGFNVLMKK